MIFNHTNRKPTRINHLIISTAVQHPPLLSLDCISTPPGKEGEGSTDSSVSVLLGNLVFNAE